MTPEDVRERLRKEARRLCLGCFSKLTRRGTLHFEGPHPSSCTFALNLAALEAAYSRGVADERERATKIAESGGYPNDFDKGSSENLAIRAARNEIAAAIRSQEGAGNG